MEIWWIIILFQVFKINIFSIFYQTPAHRSLKIGFALTASQQSIEIENRANLIQIIFRWSASSALLYHMKWIHQTRSLFQIQLKYSCSKSYHSWAFYYGHFVPYFQIALLSSDSMLFLLEMVLLCKAWGTVQSTAGQTTHPEMMGTSP